MREIILTQGKVALVDDQDYTWLSRWKWCAIKSRRGCGDTWYAIRCFRENGKTKTVYMHREIATMAWLYEITGCDKVDHKNHDGCDNQRHNLRPCRNGQNMANSRRKLDASSEFRGVLQHGRRWRAQITKNGRTRYIGLFKDNREAAQAYDDTAVKEHGEFASLNLC